MITLAPALAAVIERYLGYPAPLQRSIRHPVQWMGDLIGHADAELNLHPEEQLKSNLLGAAALLAIVAAFVIPALIAQWLVSLLPLPSFWLAILATPLIAQKSLREHVLSVDRAMSSSLQESRLAVAQIVGRDTSRLDESGVAKAALESLAENTADGVVAPLFWFALLGLPGLVAYKVINTADSMIGHLSAAHRHFGYAAAKLDDLINLPASRLTGLCFAASALADGTAAAKRALSAMWNDAGKHRSPNAGWPEAAMAGALGVAFGGPRNYEGEMVDLPRMGDGRDVLNRADIVESLKLYDRALWIMTLLLVLLAVVL